MLNVISVANSVFTFIVIFMKIYYVIYIVPLENKMLLDVSNSSQLDISGTVWVNNP